MKVQTPLWYLENSSYHSTLQGKKKKKKSREDIIEVHRPRSQVQLQHLLLASVTVETVVLAELFHCSLRYLSVFLQSQKETSTLSLFQEKVTV